MKNEELDHILEKSFKIKPDFHLPVDFAQKVTLTVVRRVQWKNDLREYLLITSVIMALLSAAGGLYYYLDKQLVSQAFTFVTANALQVACILFILNFILLTDRVLLPLLFNKWSSR
jgi:hypothetical protein